MSVKITIECSDSEKAAELLFKLGVTKVALDNELKKALRNKK